MGEPGREEWVYWNYKKEIGERMGLRQIRYWDRRGDKYPALQKGVGYRPSFRPSAAVVSNLAHIVEPPRRCVLAGVGMIASALECADGMIFRCDEQRNGRKSKTRRG